MDIDKRDTYNEMVSGSKRGLNVPFGRIRRITGYLTTDLTTWNSAKRAEEGDRVKHNIVR